MKFKEIKHKNIKIILKLHRKVKSIAYETLVTPNRELMSGCAVAGDYGQL